MARTAGEVGSWLLLAALLGAVVAQPLVGCIPTVEPNDDPEIAQLLAAVGPEVVLPALRRFSEELVTLSAAVEAWDLAVGTEQATPTLHAAQAALNQAMQTWQHVELFQIGPLASSLTGVAGGDLRDAIYSWPTSDPCRVDQEVVEAEWDNPDFFEVNLVNTTGMDALEHLLFAGPDNACSSVVPINQDGTWAALGEDGVNSNRARFALELVQDIAVHTDDAITAWEADFGLSTPGLGAYSDAQTALNAVFDALFYLEKTTKDRKLAQPLGLTGCDADQCPEDVESPLSGQAIPWIAANLEGFEQLFRGGEGYGMDDLLVARGHGALSEQILTAISAAASSVEQVNAPLADAIREDPAPVFAAHDAVKEVTDLLKGDLATVLSLQLPSEAAGDND